MAFGKPLLRLLTATALLLVVAGCASSRVDWDGQVGQLTFDQAVRQLGPPDRSAALADGGQIAEWLTRRGQPGTPAFTVRSGGRYHRAWGSSTTTWVPATASTPNRYLRLTFGADSRLAAWENVSR